MAECIHFPDDPNAVCTICKPKPAHDPWEGIVKISGAGYDAVGFEAKYGGTCANCGANIYPGDWITRMGNDYKHVDCRG